MPNNSLISLKTFDFKPSTFTPVTYTPIQQDYKPLGEAYAVQNQREAEANKQIDTIDATLLSIKDALNPSEHSMLSERADQIRNKIDTQLALGNWQSAIRLGREEAKNLGRDEELQNKIKVNQLYQAEKNKVLNNSKYSDLTKLRWEYENPYSYNGTVEYSPTWKPVDDIGLDTLWRLANQITPESSVGSSVQNAGNTYQTYYDSNGNIIENPSKNTKDIVGIHSTTTTTGSGTSNTIQEKTSESIEKTFYNLLNVPEYKRALNQEFDNYIWAYNFYNQRQNDNTLSENDRIEAQRKVKELKSFVTDKDGLEYTKDDFDKWLSDKSKPMFKSMSYRKITSGVHNGSESTIFNDDLFKYNKQKSENEDASIAEDLGAIGTPAKIMYGFMVPQYDSDKFTIFYDEVEE